MPSIVKPEECVVDTYNANKSGAIAPPLLALATPQKVKAVEAQHEPVPRLATAPNVEIKEGKDDGRHSEYIKLVGLPFDCGMRAVKDFVQPFSMYPNGRNIFLMKDKRGRDSCKAMVRMASEEEARMAAAGLHKKYMGWRYIEVYHVGEKECGWYSLPLMKYDTEYATQPRDHRYRGSSISNTDDSANYNNYINPALFPVAFGRGSSVPVAYSYFQPWYMYNTAPVTHAHALQHPMNGQQQYNFASMVPVTETQDETRPSTSPMLSESSFGLPSLDDSSIESVTEEAPVIKEETSECPKRAGIFVHNPYSLPSL